MKEQLCFSSVLLGDRISVYVTAKNAVAYAKSARTLDATVIGLETHPNNDKRVVTALIGWKKGERAPTKPNNYRYGGVMAPAPVSVERAIQNRNNNRVGDHYEGNNRWWYFVEDITDYDCCSWMYAHLPIPPQTSTKVPFNMHEGQRGPFSFIKASDVQGGDTVAFIDNNKPVYATVREVEECEGNGDTPMVSLQCDMYVEQGMKSFFVGYPVAQNSPVILINRGAR